MTPAEHYAEAERLLEEAQGHAGRLKDLEVGMDLPPDARLDLTRLVATAQVHATLATVSTQMLADAKKSQRYPIPGVGQFT